MNFLWKLVLIAIISAGLTDGSDPEDITDLNKEETRQETFLTSSDIISTAKFQCQNKPSGYYADPRFDCKVFHFCHEDGTKVTIPCILESEKHNICIFRDITFNACEGSEIYLALPEDLHMKPPKDTTASAINSATDFKLSNVLPFPNSPSENNQSTTPLSLEFGQTAKLNSLIDSKEYGSIFEVFNSVLREIQAEKNDKIPPSNSNFLKRSPATFSRGSKFQASSIRRDDSNDELQSEDQRSENQAAFLVEVYKGDEKLLDNHNSYKKSKRLFFLPKTQKKTPGTHPRRKRRTVTEPLAVSRPYAVIYAKVPDIARSSNPEVPIKNPSERKDIVEVPFVAARVPADVPTIPITIETRRKRKNKSRKKAKKNSQIFYIQETSPDETDHEQTSEQQNVLFFSPEQVPGVGLRGVHDRAVIDDRYRPRQNLDQAQYVSEQISNKAQAAQNNLQANYQARLAPQNGNNIQLPSFPFQSTTYLSNSNPQPFYFGSQNLNQPRNFPSFGLSDQFVLQPQQPQEVQPQSFRQPEIIQTQTIRQQGNNNPQIIRQPENSVQISNQHGNNRQIHGRPESVWTQNIRQAENIVIQPANHQENTPQRPAGQPESRPRQIASDPENIQSQSARTPGSSSQSFRQPENNRPPIFRQPETIQIQTYRQPETAQPQTYRQPETVQPQTFRQPETIQTQTFRQPENMPQALRQPERVQPQRVRQPEIIQPQTIRQLQDIQLRNIPPLPFGQPEGVLHQPISATQSNKPHLQNADTQNTPTNDQNNRPRNLGARQQRLPESAISQRFPGFDSPFFQGFPNFGTLHFNGPFAQPGPPTYDLLPPPGSQFQEPQDPQQHVSNHERVREQVPQQLEKPQDQTIPQYATLSRPQNSNQQQYPSHIRQQMPETVPQSGVIYLPQPNQNPNLIQSERVKQERPNLGNENPGAQILVAIPQPARPSRNRGRPTSATESPEHHQERQRNRGQAQRQIFRNPQEDRIHEKPRQESQQHSSPRRPSEQQYTPPEVAYRPQRPPVNDNPNENRYRPPSPSLNAVPDFRLQESPHPQNIRDDDKKVAQRQPNRQRNRQYYNDNSNRQTIPQYSTYQQTPTTPIPSLPPRQRVRQPEQYRPRETHQNVRPLVEDTASTPVDDRPYYGYRSSDSPYERPRVSPLSYERSKTTAVPYERPRTSSSPYQRPRTSASPYERPRITESPYERPRTSASPYERPRTSASPYERPRTSASPYERPVTSAPHYEKPRTFAPSYENSRTRTSPVQHQSQGVSVTNRYFVTSRPRFRPSEVENTRYNQDEAPESHYERPRTRPQAQIERPPPEYVNAESLSEEHLRPQRYNSHRTQHNANVDNNVNIVSTVEDSDHRPRTPTGGSRQQYREPSSERQKYSPAIEHGFLPVSERPQREYSRATAAPERHYREPESERVRGNRYHSYDEEIPTTRLVTTPKPTQKRKPPPPRPTFPAFPTFPPPPRRIASSPRPTTTEEPDKEDPKTIVYATEEPRTTRETIQRSRSKIEDISEVANSRDSVTENYLHTEAPEITTKRRARKRRPRPRRPKSTTPYPNDDEDVVQVDTITQATTRREVSTRSTQSNYNRWRQQTPPQRKTTASPSTEAPATEASGGTEEYGSRINLFGRPRTRKPAFSPRTATTTQTAPLSEERRRSSKVPTATRTRKPFAKKVRKKTTTETPDTTEQIARSDENDEFLHFNSDVNSLQGLESVTQLSVENAEESFATTESYNDVVETTMETTTLNNQDELSLDSNDKVEDFESTRSLSKKFQNRPRILKFGKPRLRTSDSIDLNAAESKIY